MTLRRQIAAVIALVSCLVACTVAVLVHRASVGQHTDQARASAEAALDAVLTGYDRTGELVGGWHAAVDDPAVPADLRALAARGRQGSLLGPGPNGTAMWAAAGCGGRVVSVRLDFAGDEQAVADLDRAVQIAAALSVAVTVLAGVLAADRISHRLRTAARTARTIAAATSTHGSDRSAAAATRSSNWPPPSTRWPPRCAAGWRTSSASPPTSRTSCALR
ncbi:hypothetical protein ACFQ1I_44660 [Kitasatospora arboriphila]